MRNAYREYNSLLCVWVSQRDLILYAHWITYLYFAHTNRSCHLTVVEDNPKTSYMLTPMGYISTHIMFNLSILVIVKVLGICLMKCKQQKLR